MSSVLTVGRLVEFLVDDVEGVLEQIGASAQAGRWLACPEEVAVISLINVSSVSFFNKFAAGLEGLTGYDAMERTRFKNLPWWLSAVWLPIEINPPVVTDGGDPVFVGSIARLQAELSEIQRLAPHLKLGTVPAEFDVMRKDYGAWWRGLLERPEENQRLSEDDTIRWVWRALYDGAELGRHQDAPVFWFGG